MLKADGQVNDFEIRFRRLDGTEFVGALSAKIIEFNGEDVIVSVVSDVTERIEREAKLRQILDVSPIPILMYRIPDDEIAYENPAAETLFGTSNRKSSDGTYSRWVDQEDRGRVIGRILSTGKVDNVEIQLNRADETPFWGAISARLISYRGEDVIIAIVYDLSERIRLEQALREGEESIRTILETSPVPLSMIRAEDGKIIYESPAARELYGVDETGGPATTLDRWTDLGIRKALVKQLRTTGVIEGVDVTHKRSDGTEFPVALSARLIEYKGEEVIVSSYFDLTERLAVQKELALQREALHQNEKMNAMGHLLASVAHELNNPLSVVVGQSSLLAETAMDLEASTRAERISSAANRCARIVKSFLAMARDKPRKRVMADPNEIMKTALDATGYALRNSSVEVTTEFVHPCPLVFADFDQLVQVFTNLIVNADHALAEIPAPKRLAITSYHDSIHDQVVMILEDNGPGIPDELRTRIFEPFFTTKEQGSGTGIGLALCHRIIETHGGQISIETAEKGGARFVIRLPAADDSAIREEERSEIGARPRKLSILVVDDDADVAGLIEDILHAGGNTVTIASSGPEALELLDDNEFDAILSDFRMPGMNGRQFYDAVEQHNPNILKKLGFLTGDTLSADVTAFLKATQCPYFEKPVTPRDVEKIVSILADQHSDASEGNYRPN